MNDVLKNLLHAGIGLAVSATEKIQKVVDELVVRGKEYQESIKNKEEEAKAETNKEEAPKAETQAETTAKTEETTATETHNRFEEIEQKIRRWIDTAIARFGFIRNDDHEKIAERIARLEEKLSQLAKDAAEQSADNTADRM